jgi:hypothetical protein
MEVTKMNIDEKLYLLQKIWKLEEENLRLRKELKKLMELKSELARDIREAIKIVEKIT